MALIKSEEEIETVWNKKRIGVAFLLVLLFIGTGFFLKSKFAAGQDGGSVAGTSATREREVIKIPTEEDLENKIESIKKEIQELRPEDITKQEPVKKILSELEVLQASATSQVVGGTKDILCEEVKKLICK
ncbi:hypothetical protein HYS29_01240 [Candidatus Microgenomates bacterium]|nr:hypothetical protein [Candidatus Microgenomates bacterium]MBI2622255.1 hypothetical protein [Candidatus Microgenomates bacterium]